MKKILLVMLLIVGSIKMASAQVCKISETNDNVEVFSATLRGANTVEVIVSNDSKDISANVTVTVKVKYGDYSETYTGKCLAHPRQKSEITITIAETRYNKKATNVEVISISGTKCL